MVWYGMNDACLLHRWHTVGILDSRYVDYSCSGACLLAKSGWYEQQCLVMMMMMMMHTDNR